MNTIDHEYAGFWRRFWAYFIDYHSTLGILQAFYYLNLTASKGLLIGVNALFYLVWAGYFMFFHSIWSRSPGKVILGLTVVSTAGKPISKWQAILRYVPDAIFCFAWFMVADIVAIPTHIRTQTSVAGTTIILWQIRLFWIGLWLGLLWGLANVVALLANEQKMTLRDRLAGTRVVKLQSLGNRRYVGRVFVLMFLPWSGSAFLNLIPYSTQDASAYAAIGIALYLITLFLVVGYTWANLSKTTHPMVAGESAVDQRT